MNNNITHPKHYTSHPSGIECIEITRHHNYNIGNAIKYLWRAGIKQEQGKSCKDKEIEDLQKAVWYIQDYINTLQGSHKQDKCKCSCQKEKGHYIGLDRNKDDYNDGLTQNEINGLLAAVNNETAGYVLLPMVKQE